MNTAKLSTTVCSLHLLAKPSFSFVSKCNINQVTFSFLPLQTKRYLLLRSRLNHVVLSSSAAAANSGQVTVQDDLQAFLEVFSCSNLLLLKWVSVCFSVFSSTCCFSIYLQFFSSAYVMNFDSMFSLFLFLFWMISSWNWNNMDYWIWSFWQILPVDLREILQNDPKRAQLLEVTVLSSVILIKSFFFSIVKSQC